MNKLQELRIHVDALLTAAEQDAKFFASILHYIRSLQDVLGGSSDEVTQSRLSVLASKIETFFQRWRPTTGDFYIPPRQAGDADPTVRDITSIVNSLAEMPEAEFQQCAEAAGLRSPLDPDASMPAGSLSTDMNANAHVVDLKNSIVAHFTDENWQDIAALTDTEVILNAHPRLLKSLYFGDDDYGSNVWSVLRGTLQAGDDNLAIIEDYMDRTFGKNPGAAPFASNASLIKCKPTVFSLPSSGVELDLVSIMMPFDAAFTPVHTAIKAACETAKLKCVRADAVWESSEVIQDVFSLIFRAGIVVVDLTDRNPNVMYETGIAHTLGKQVVPITQSMEHIPFDLGHHRVLRYLNNAEGLEKLSAELAKRLAHLKDSIPET